jgi:PadR family transcriptional regulator PadR
MAKDLNQLIEKTEAQLRKGILELCILSIISEKEAYSSDIIRKLEDSRLIVVQGTVYPLLARLKNEGLLQYSWRESELGPPRKYYTITERGNDFLGRLLHTWNELTTAVRQTTKNITSDE